MENHHLPFFSQKAGFIIDSAAADPAWWIKCIKKKADGTWEKPSNQEGQNVKMNLMERASIVEALQTGNGWSTVHKFNENSTSISLQAATDGRFAYYLTIGTYNKGFASNEALLLRLFLEHLLAEKIANATVSQPQQEDVAPADAPEEPDAPAPAAKKTTAPAAKKTTAPAAKKTTAPAANGMAKAVPISTLKAGPVSGTIEGRVVSVEALREVNTRNGPSKVLSLVLADESDQIRVSLWGPDAENNQNVEQGSTLRITNVLSKMNNYSNSYEGSTGRGSAITLLEGPGEAPDLPEDIDPPFPAEGAPPAAAAPAAPVPAPLPPESASVLAVAIQGPAAYPEAPAPEAPVPAPEAPAPAPEAPAPKPPVPETPKIPAPEVPAPAPEAPAPKPPAPAPEAPQAPSPNESYLLVSGKILAETPRAIRIGQGEPDPVTHKYPVDEWIPKSQIRPGADPLVPETIVRVEVSQYVVKKNHLRVG